MRGAPFIEINLEKKRPLNFDTLINEPKLFTLILHSQ